MRTAFDRPCFDGSAGVNVQLSTWAGAVLVAFMGLLPVVTLQGRRARLVTGVLALLLVPTAVALLIRSAPGEDGSWGYLLLAVPALFAVNCLFCVGVAGAIHRLLARRSHDKPAMGVPLLSLIVWAVMGALASVWVFAAQSASRG